MAQDYAKQYPKLKYFFSSYFHMDWKSLYNWNGGTPSFEIVVRDFASTESKGIVIQATRELEQLVTASLTEADLREIVAYQLGANIYAPGLGMTYHQWLAKILSILQEVRSHT